MEDWQQWQVQAARVAAALAQDVDSLDRDFFSQDGEGSFRGFWPRFRDLKERVRTAPAIRLEDKLDLERRLRGLGSKAYKSQESAYARSAERKTELLSMINEYRTVADGTSAPKDLRDVRRDLDRVREQFDAGTALVPADRQTVWDAWRDASQHVWGRLTAAWTENEDALRAILTEARERLSADDALGVRQAVTRFFDELKTREGRQESINSMRAEADAIRRETIQTEERRASERIVNQQAQVVPAVDVWRAEVDRNKDSIARLEEDIAGLEKQYQDSGSILEQAMVRGTLVEKKRKLAEFERSTRSLEQRIEQSQDTPIMQAQ